MKDVKAEHRICDVLCSYFVCVILMCLCSKLKAILYDYIGKVSNQSENVYRSYRIFTATTYLVKKSIH